MDFDISVWEGQHLKEENSTHKLIFVIHVYLTLGMGWGIDQIYSTISKYPTEHITRSYEYKSGRKPK